MREWHGDHEADRTVSPGSLLFTEMSDRERTTQKIMASDGDGIVSYEARGYHTYALLEEQVAMVGFAKV